MGQKINPTGLRIGVIKNWESRWYADKKDFGANLVEDYELREYLLSTLAPAGVPKVEIERDAKRVYVNIHCAKPGMVSAVAAQRLRSLRKFVRKSLAAKRKFQSTSLRLSSRTSTHSLLLRTSQLSSKDVYPSVVL